MDQENGVKEVICSRRVCYGTHNILHISLFLVFGNFSATRKMSSHRNMDSYCNAKFVSISVVNERCNLKFL